MVSVLAAIAHARSGGHFPLTVYSSAAVGYFSSLFCTGADRSEIKPAFAGPVCAKGRVTPEFEVFFDGTDIVLVPQYSGVGYAEYDARKVEGVQSTKLNVGGVTASYFIAGISPMLNWTHKSIKFRFYIPPGDHNVQQVDIRLSSEGTQYTYVVWRSGSRSPRTGWIEYTFTPTHGYNPGAVHQVDRICITVLRQDAQKPAYILVNGLKVWDGRLRIPLYCCTFDDNYVRQYEAALYAAGKGIPISLFINKFCFDDPNNPRGVAIGSVGMSLAQNQELAQLGCVHINHGAEHKSTLWRDPGVPIDYFINDLEDNRQWLDENGLGFGAGIFGSPQAWWLDHHEERLLAYMFGRPRLGRGMGTYGLLTMWDENTEIRSACDTNLADAYKMLEGNVGTLLWTSGFYPTGTLREWADGGIYEVVRSDGTSEEPPHADWAYRRERGPDDEGDRAIQIDVWHHYPDGSSSGVHEGSLQDFKDYIDVVAAHIAAGRLRAVDLRQLYESYLYTAVSSRTLRGDLNSDSTVDIHDFAVMAENWLKEIKDK